MHRVICHRSIPPSPACLPSPRAHLGQADSTSLLLCVRIRAGSLVSAQTSSVRCHVGDLRDELRQAAGEGAPQPPVLYQPHFCRRGVVGEVKNPWPTHGRSCIGRCARGTLLWAPLPAVGHLHPGSRPGTVSVLRPHQAGCLVSRRGESRRVYGHCLSLLKLLVGSGVARLEHDSSWRL